MNIREEEEKIFKSDCCYGAYLACQKFEVLRQKFGTDKLFYHRVFQKTREMWATAVFSLGLSAIDDITYWVEPHYGDTPDTILHFITPHDKIVNANINHVISVEVKDWEKHGGENLVDYIMGILDKKKYPEHYVLLVHALRGGMVIDLEKVFIKLNQQLKLDIGGIWLLSSAIGKTEDNYKLVCIYKNKMMRDFSLRERLLNDKNNNKYQVVKFFNRKKGTGFFTLEEYDSGLPEIQFN